MKTENLHIEIAGGGIAGLTAAAALCQAGCSVRVHERGDELREIGAGIFMWENALRVLEAIGAYDEAISGSEHNEYWEFRDERERLLQSGWMMQGARLNTVLRTQLHRALANTAIRSGAEIITGSRAIGATAEGELITADGTRYKADLVIGADGVQSPVRTTMGMTAYLEDLRDGCARYLVPRLPEDAELKGKSMEYWNGGRRIGVVPSSSDEIYLYLCCPADDMEGRLSPADHATWSKSFPALEKYIERIVDNGRWATFIEVHVREWHKGRVALVGDSVGATSPNLGQGAAVAMQSGFVLADMLKKSDSVEEALMSWERNFRPIVESVQRYSRLYGRIGTRWPRPLLDFRSALVWTIGKSTWWQKRVNEAAHTDVTANAAI